MFEWSAPLALVLNHLLRVNKYLSYRVYKGRTDSCFAGCYFLFFHPFFSEGGAQCLTPNLPEREIFDQTEHIQKYLLV